MLRNTELTLEFHPDPSLTEDTLRTALQDESLTVEKRILAAMGLSSRLRVASAQPIDLPCVDLGPAQIVLFPAESFVGLQLMAQQLRPDSFVMSIGYGECWPGYIPTEAAFQDGFHEGWQWVARGSEQRIRSRHWNACCRRSDRSRRRSRSNTADAVAAWTDPGTRCAIVVRFGYLEG